MADMTADALRSGLRERLPRLGPLGGAVRVLRAWQTLLNHRVILRGLIRLSLAAIDIAETLQQLAERMRHGVLSFPLTAFTPDGSGIDLDAFRRHVRTRIDAGASAMAESRTRSLASSMFPARLFSTGRNPQSTSSCATFCSTPNDDGDSSPWWHSIQTSIVSAIFARPPARSGFAELPGRRVALDARAARPLAELDPEPPLVLCVGAEREGLPSELVTGAEEGARIDLRAGGPESLNAAMAATIALYDLGTRMADRA